MIKLDRLDLKLIASLQRNNQLTAEELAGEVGLSPSAAARRIRRLRADGAIIADTSIVSEQAVGLPLSAVVQVQLERHSQNELDALRRQLRASDNVQLCLEISGTFDIMLLVIAADMDSFNELMDGLVAANRAVRRYETSFVKRRVKATLALPLDQLADGV